MHSKYKKDICIVYREGIVNGQIFQKFCARDFFAKWSWTIV